MDPAASCSRNVGVARNLLDVDRRGRGLGLGTNAVFQSNDGNGSTIPIGIFVALFASIGTWAVAKYVLHRSDT
jgi:hypothetical protein